MAGLMQDQLTLLEPLPIAEDEAAESLLASGVAGQDCRSCRKSGQRWEALSVPNLWLAGSLLCALSLVVLCCSLQRLGGWPGLPKHNADHQEMQLRAETESRYFTSDSSFLSRVHQIEANGGGHHSDNDRAASSPSQDGDQPARGKDSDEDGGEPAHGEDSDKAQAGDEPAHGHDSEKDGDEPARGKDSEKAEDQQAATEETPPQEGMVHEPTFSCTSSVKLANATVMENKGLDIDDTTFSQCPSLGLTKWPNTDKKLMAVRLFKAWDARWDATYDRKAIWEDLREYVWENGIKVLFGTQISCNETADDADWAYVKELMAYIGWYYAMGLAIGNEVELIHTHPDSPPDCIPRLFQQKYFQRKVDARIEEMDKLEGFQNVPLTTVMGGFVLAADPFINTPQAGVADFFRYVSGKYGRRWVYTWNVYPYFEPNVNIDPHDPAACHQVINAAQSFSQQGMITTQLRSLRQKTQMVTGRPDDVTWLGETGWSWPRAATLNTIMSSCQNFSSRENFQNYYRNFLQWDLSLGDGVAPLNHAFFFTMRDSHNWDLSEYFGLVQNCGSKSCKLQA